MASGIYTIYNKVSHKYYVGSSRNIANRWYAHRAQLNKQKHTNLHLQRAWNKNGSSAFDWTIIEEVLPELLATRECYWIRFYNSDREGYNVVGEANGQFTHPEKLRVWEGFITPDGAEVTILNLPGFCYDNNLDYGAMANIGRGRPRACQGWGHKNTPDVLDRGRPRHSVTKEALLTAITTIAEPSYRKLARLFGVNRMTIQRRVLEYGLASLFPEDERRICTP